MKKSKTSEVYTYRTTASKEVPAQKLALVGLAAVVLGAGVPAPSPAAWQPSVPLSSSSLAARKSVRAEDALGELRRLSGLTFEQLARLFQTSRRAIHFWASGKPMSAANEELLHRLLAVIRGMDRGTAGENREALLNPRVDGSIPFDLLINKEYERAAVALGPAMARKRPKPPQLTSEEKAARRPWSPDQLVGALQDSVHIELEGSRGIQFFKAPA